MTENSSFPSPPFFPGSQNDLRRRKGPAPPPPSQPQPPRASNHVVVSEPPKPLAMEQETKMDLGTESSDEEDRDREFSPEKDHALNLLDDVIEEAEKGIMGGDRRASLTSSSSGGGSSAASSSSTNTHEDLSEKKRAPSVVSDGQVSAASATAAPAREPSEGEVVVVTGGDNATTVVSPPEDNNDDDVATAGTPNPDMSHVSVVVLGEASIQVIDSSLTTGTIPFNTAKSFWLIYMSYEKRVKNELRMSKNDQI